MKKLVYPVKFEKEEDGQYSVYLLDFDNVATCGKDLADAIFMAEDLLGNMAIDYEEDKKCFPKATPLTFFEKNTENSFVNLVSIDFDEYKKKVSDKPIRKTVYIPKGLNDAAEAAGVNFSQILRDALSSIV